MKRIVGHIYEEIKSPENLLAAWEEFVKNKKKRTDVSVFAQTLLYNVFSLHQDLSNFTYQHASYEEFRISDPKPRIIHKATVRDRLLHHAVYRVLYPLFDRTFVFDSYSCRKNKGTHKAFKRLEYFSRKISRNYTQPCYALKFDIKKFFDNIDHQVLLGLLTARIEDRKLLKLLENIIRSFQTFPGKGMPLGNLTSQLFANIYLDPVDKFIKHRFKIKYYLRYADDFLLVGDNSEELLNHFFAIKQFLKTELKLNVHPDKIYLRKLRWGIDFVGYVVLPYYSVLRTKTKRRMLKRINQKNLPSYLGLLRHCHDYKLSEIIADLVKI